MALAPGTRIGPYEVIAWIGAGAMGQVYRARDARLGRDVALKVLAETVATDPSRTRRFELEARAAGQLSHPNILAIYDVGLQDQQPYIVSELLDGESLRARLDAGPLPRRKALEYARQVAYGLAAAHEKHIVHRDLKPENVFVTADGRVKILDFGIAKLMESSGPDERDTRLATETLPGMVVGTPAYMSPEQVRGEAVDARSDIFSFGAMLFEMVTGRSAFGRGTAVDTMTAILRDDTPVLPPDLAESCPGMDRILTRCLDKDREGRFQSARDLGFALEGVPATGSIATRRVAIDWRRWRMAATVAVLAMAGSLAAWMATRRTPAPSGNPLDGARFTRFTDWDGTEAAAEISRDGRFVAFLSDRDGDRDGHFDLFWSQVGTGRFTKLSAELPPINPPSRIFRSLGFSADGSEIWVIAGGGNRKLILPITGGAARPFLGLRATSAAWSPDGSRLVYFVNGDGDPVFMADGQGGDAHEILPAAAGGHNHNPIWSRDGQWIYFTRGIVHGLDQNDEMDIWRMRPNGESLEQLTHRRTWVNYLAMLDDHTLLYISPDDERAGRSLWSLDLASRTSTRLTFGVQQYTSVAVSEDGRRIVVSAANPASGLWRVPIFHDRPAEESDVTPAGTPTAQAIEPRIGGTSTFYISSGGTADGLWRMGPDGTSTVWRDSDGEMAEPPAVSADGARVVLVITQRGTRHLTMLAGDGTGARTLGPGIEPQGAAAWSPDGQWVIVGGQDRQGPALFKIKADTGEVQRFLNQPAFNPAWSRNGLIVFTGNIAGGSVPLVAVRSTGEPVAIPSVKVRPGSYRFLPDGSALVLLDHAATLNWTIVDVKSWTARPLTNLKNRGVVRGFDITPDERYLLFDRSRENSDIVLIDRASR